MRSNAVFALGEAARNPQGNPSAIVAALLPLLNDDDDEGMVMVRSSVTTALGQAASNPQGNPTEIVAALLPFLNDANFTVRNNAAIALTEAYAKPGQLATDPAHTYLFTTLIDPVKALGRPSAARALFKIALRDPVQAQAIRATLETDAYTRSPQPITRLWSNKLLTMLELVTWVQPAAPLTAEQRTQLQARLEAAKATSFFGEDFTWAAGEAISWLADQAQAESGGAP